LNILDFFGYNNRITLFFYISPLQPLAVLSNRAAFLFAMNILAFTGHNKNGTFPIIFSLGAAQLGAAPFLIYLCGFESRSNSFNLPITML